MSIKLNSPFDPGDNDPGKTYAECQITAIHHNAMAGSVTIDYEFGDTVADGTWTPGPGAARRNLVIGGDDFYALATKPAVAQETVFQGVKRVCYQWMIDKNVAAGVIQ